MGVPQLPLGGTRQMTLPQRPMLCVPVRMIFRERRRVLATTARCAV
jgi:hypothetical protein